MKYARRWQRMKNAAPWLMLKTFVTVIYIFMMTPILITAIVSVNADNRSTFPPKGFSLQWWHEALSTRWIDPIWFSLKLAIATSIVATIFGLLLAYALHRFRFVGREAILALTMAPLMLPALITSIGLLQFFHFTGLRSWIGMPSLLIGHVVISIPYAVRTISISLANMPANLRQAAMSLGAGPMTAFRLITVPLIKSGIFAGVVFIFIHSFNDVTMSLFISRPGAQPIPVAILNFMEYGFAPTLAAVAIITVIIPLVLIIAVERMVGIGNFIYRS